jgi:hypothetical protein
MTVAPLSMLPAALAGIWTFTSEAPCVGDGFEFSERTATLRRQANVECRYEGVKAQHADRWYLDLACADGSLVQLDVNRRGHDTLLIAPRPLGEAHVYGRCRLN